MAKKSMVNKQQRTPKFSTRAYTRCKICGRGVVPLPYLFVRVEERGALDAAPYKITFQAVKHLR